MAILFVDLMSQPSRACALFVRLNRLPVEERILRIDKGDTRKPEYRALHPSGKVPVLEDGELALPESGAILAYLAGTHASRIQDHWYPSNLRRRALVDSCMHWYHGSIRRAAGGLVWNRVIAKRLGMGSSEAAAVAHENGLAQALQEMQDLWLQDRPFLTGEDVSVADLLCACELEQLCLLPPAAGSDGSDAMASLLRPFPKARKWLQRVATRCGKDYSDIHSFLWKSAATSKQAKL